MEASSITVALKTDATDNNPLKQWVHLLPSGQFQGRDGRGPWQLSDPDRVVLATQQYAGKNLLPVDYEHQIDLAEKNGQPAPAAGWVEGLEVRSDGIWGLVEWTDKAIDFLRSKEYKYLSPVMQHTKDGKIIRILRAALTNNPALEMTALAKAEDNMNDNDNSNSQSAEPDLSELIQLLGLEENATLADVSEALKKLLTTQNSSKPDPAQYVPLGEFKQVVEDLQAATEHTVLAKVDDAINNHLLPPKLREWGVSMCRHDAQAFDEFVGSIKTIYGFIQTCQTDRLTAEERALLDEPYERKTGTVEIYDSLGLSQADVEKYGEGK